MSNEMNIGDLVYQRAFENTLSHIDELRNRDKTFGIEDLQNLLETEYVHQGNAWAGRGEVQSATIAASIAAIELLLTRWKNE